MNQREEDVAALAAHVGVNAAPPAGAPNRVNGQDPDEKDLEDLPRYQAIPPRHSRTVLVRVQHGGRLRPLPYALDEDL